MQYDIWICIPPIPNKYARENYTYFIISSSVFDLILIYFILCTQHEPYPGRQSHYPYKHIKQKPMQTAQEIYHIFDTVNRILKGSSQWTGNIPQENRIRISGETVEV